MLNIGIIGGTGWLGKAIGDALLKGLIQPTQLWVSNHSGRNNYAEPTHFTTNTQSLIDACDVVIISVRPEQFAALNIQAEDKLVISVMARTALDYTAQHIKAKRIIRAMPNVAIAKAESYTPWFANPAVTAEDKKIARDIFACLGMQHEVSEEDHINLLTAITGSSHGWLAYLAAAMVDFGVEHGLEEKDMETAVRQVMRGIGRLIAEEPRSPQQTLEHLVTIPGTTTAGLKNFEGSHLADLIKKGLQASYEKACEKRQELR